MISWTSHTILFSSNSFPYEPWHRWCNFRWLLQSPPTPATSATVTHQTPSTRSLFLSQIASCYNIQRAHNESNYPVSLGRGLEVVRSEGDERVEFRESGSLIWRVVRERGWEIGELRRACPNLLMNKTPLKEPLVQQRKPFKWNLKMKHKKKKKKQWKSKFNKTKIKKLTACLETSLSLQFWGN